MPTLDSELRNVLRTGKALLGAKESIKAIKLGRAKVVVIAGNVDPRVRREIVKLTGLTNVPILEFPGTSVELGTILGKPYPVQAVAVLDVGDSRIMELVGTGR